jgi:hypothetical protein
MATNVRLVPFIILALLFGASATGAQSLGPDEAMGPDGTAAQTLALTPVQRSAIYSAVMQQHVRSSNRGITPAIGAPVPPSAALSDLPDQPALGTDGTPVLKYAMVQEDVVVVDPITMRVVDVIHPGARP